MAPEGPSYRDDAAPGVEPARIFHITTAQAWDDGVPDYRGDTLDSEGFIHCSRPDQVLTVANARFLGVAGLVLLEIEPDRVTASIRYENLEGGDDLFPHIYGPLNWNAVVGVHPFEADSEGTFAAPEALSKWL